MVVNWTCTESCRQQWGRCNAVMWSAGDVMHLLELRPAEILERLSIGGKGRYGGDVAVVLVAGIASERDIALHDRIRRRQHESLSGRAIGPIRLHAGQIEKMT